jgi:hypothetical protein
LSGHVVGKLKASNETLFYWLPQVNDPGTEGTLLANRHKYLDAPELRAQFGVNHGKI